MIMRRTCVHDNGHYRIGIPWKEGCLNLPNNYQMAMSRLNSLGRRLMANSEIRSKYTEKIRDMIAQGQAIEVPVECRREDNRTWYIPHHCVTEKFCVVFDCAGQFQGTSLNSQILQGSDNMNNLVGVLMRFRKHSVAIVGDLQAMFIQVKVDEVEQHALHFLWWTDDDSAKPP